MSEPIGECGCRLERTEKGLKMIDCPLHEAAPDLFKLVEEAFERFTDNDFQPPNEALRNWLDRASKIFVRIRIKKEGRE